MAGAKSLVLLCFLLAIASSQAAPPCHSNRAEVEAERKEMMMMEMMEELIGSNHKLTERCKYNLCYRWCRAKGGSKEACAKKCNCTQGTAELAASTDELATEVELGRKAEMMEALAATRMEVAYNRAEVEAELKEMMMMEMMEELIGSNHKLTEKCKYNLCYRWCRAKGGSKEACAKKCNCTQVTAELAASTDDEASKATDE